MNFKDTSQGICLLKTTRKIEPFDLLFSTDLKPFRLLKNCPLASSKRQGMAQDYLKGRF